MAQATLYEAFDAFNEQYLTALSGNSKRKIEQLDKDWQKINNYYNIYIQASAEGETTAADEAIGAIVTILGGDIDISVLPSIGGTITERDGVESVTPVETKINFASDIGSTNYRLIINLHNSAGAQLGYILGSQETDGFTITPSFSGTLTYNAKLL